MSSEPTKTDKLAGTVVITDFAERRARENGQDEAHDKETLVPGTQIGHYLIVERLGGGGMGVVYKAQDTELDRRVALKILPPHLCRNPEYLERFRSEAQAHARLNNPYVILLYSILELPVGEVLVLEYVEGQTLEQRLRAGGPLEPAEAVRIFDQALRAVEHAHMAGVVHRDLKPSNLFITRDGTVKLMDFGVAKMMDRPEHNPNRAMVGTLLYIAPEQINGHNIDFRSDVYTLGVSLFEAVAGRLPFERRSDYALMHAHVQDRPPSPKEFQREIPTSLEAVIMKAIEKDPNRRFQSVVEFRMALLQTKLVERRQRRSRRSLSSAITGPHRTRRLLRGLWLDAALITAVVALFYSLDIYPITSKKSEAVAPTVTTYEQPTPTLKQTPTPAPATPKAPSGNKPAKQYDALRDAWSN